MSAQLPPIPLNYAPLLTLAVADCRLVGRPSSPYHTLSAALNAGRRLIVCSEKLGKESLEAYLAAEASINKETIDLYCGLASHPKLAQCRGGFAALEVMHENLWRTMRQVVDGCGLGDSLSRSKIAAPAGSREIENVALCRYSSGFLVRVSVGASPEHVAERIEFSTGTKDPVLARLIRDALYRGFDAAGVLPHRSRVKWQAYLLEEGNNPDDWPSASDGYVAKYSHKAQADSVATTIIRGLVEILSEQGHPTGDDPHPVHRQASDYLDIADSEK